MTNTECLVGQRPVIEELSSRHNAPPHLHDSPHRARRSCDHVPAAEPLEPTEHDAFVDSEYSDHWVWWQGSASSARSMAGYLFPFPTASFGPSVQTLLSTLANQVACELNLSPTPQRPPVFASPPSSSDSLVNKIHLPLETHPIINSLLIIATD